MIYWIRVTKKFDSLIKINILTYIPLLEKSRVVIMQICRESTENSSTSDMNINLFLGSKNIFLPYYGW